MRPEFGHSKMVSYTRLGVVARSLVTLYADDIVVFMDPIKEDTDNLFVHFELLWCCHRVGQ